MLRSTLKLVTLVLNLVAPINSINNIPKLNESALESYAFPPNTSGALFFHHINN